MLASLDSSESLQKTVWACEEQLDFLPGSPWEFEAGVSLTAAYLQKETDALVLGVVMVVKSL